MAHDLHCLDKETLCSSKRKHILAAKGFKQTVLMQELVAPMKLDAVKYCYVGTMKQTFMCVCDFVILVWANWSGHIFFTYTYIFDSIYTWLK